jgi:aspartate racemase
MPRHIGIIGCSAEGAALCYRTICQEGEKSLGRYGHPEVSMHTHSFSDYMGAIESGNWRAVGELMLDSAEKLAKAGADFFVCPDNTIHQALPFIQPRLPRPLLHIAEIVADEAVRRGFNCIGLLGTRYLVESEVYPQALAQRALKYVRPEPAERQEINRIIFDELVCGVFKPEAIAYHRRVISHLKANGCDAVVLGCTEIPLIMNDENSPLPTLDSTRLLARGALKNAIAIR